MTKRLHLLTAVSALTLFASPAFSTSQTFDTPITLSPTQAAGTWYTDRYAPAGFASQATDPNGGTNRLQLSINAADAQTVGNNFYNTQGRKFDLEAGTKSVTIDLFVHQKWASINKRMAGFWGTGVDVNGDVSSYPIILFENGSFKVWDSNTGIYDDLGLPTGFNFGTYQTLTYSLSGSQIFYNIGDLTGSFDANGTVSFSNVILQGYNTPAGDTYSIYWDNLNSAVPEPATWAMMIGGFALAGAAMRRKKAVVAFA